ncbi:DsbA family protein [Kutzneria sp. NPDC052558]|uniref:DsbA family protein n=1 Tax=Kutzneria sp. NPDC052558 TaxID=3364121 RepID=UPI0037C6A372
MGAAQNNKRNQNKANAGQQKSAPGQNHKRDRNKANAARAVAAARGARNDRRNIAIGVVAVIVVAVAVIAAVIITTQQSAPPAASGTDGIKITNSSSQYTTTVGDDGTVIGGPDTAKVKIDVYEDFTCPYCGELETASGAQMAKAMADGQLQVKYHLLNILDANTKPAGYSTLAANAAIAAAKQGKFADFHASLYAAQPKEGGPGYTNDQLISLGKRLGITAPQFADDVNKGAYNNLVTQQVTTASAPPVNLQGTPTVMQGTTAIQALQDPQWLDKLLNA